MTQGAELKLIVDSREPAGLRLKILSTFPTGECDVQKLEFGDYSILSSGLLIERKTIADFLSSWGQGRLDRQLEGCATESSGNSALLLEGQWTVSPSGFVQIGHQIRGWKVQSFVKKLLEVQRRYECRVIPSYSATTTTLILKALSL